MSERGPDFRIFAGPILAQYHGIYRAHRKPPSVASAHARGGSTTSRMKCVGGLQSAQGPVMCLCNVNLAGKMS